MKRALSFSATSLSRRKALWGGATVAAAATSMAAFGNASAASSQKNLPHHDENHPQDFIMSNAISS